MKNNPDFYDFFHTGFDHLSIIFFLIDLCQGGSCKLI